MSRTTGVANFVYGFVFGDDWKVAAVMLAALAASGLLVSRGVNAWWLVPPLAVAMTVFSLRGSGGLGRPARAGEPV